MADYIKLTMNKKIEDEKSKKDLSQDGFDFEDETYIKKIELEDDIMVEQYELITTTVEIYVTAIWTNGSQAEVRVSIPVEYVAGHEEEIADQIEAQVETYLIEYGEGFDRDGVEFDFQRDQYDFVEGTSGISYEEKPVIEKGIGEGGFITQQPREPTGTERTGRFLGKVAKGTVRAVGTGVNWLGKGISAIGRAVSGIGKFLGGR